VFLHQQFLGLIDIFAPQLSGVEDLAGIGGEMNINRPVGRAFDFDK
jgi:hypothetical protein